MAQDDRWFTDYAPSERWPHYTRANAGEVMPSPVSPLCQKFTWDAGIIHGAAEGSCRAGLYEPEEYDPLLPEVFGFFGDHPDVPPYVEHPDDAKPHLASKIEAQP